MPGVNYYDGSEFQAVSTIEQSDGGIAEVYRWTGSKWFEIFPGAPASGVSRFRFEQAATDYWGSNDLTDNTSAGYSTTAAEGTYSKAFDGTDDTLTLNSALVADQSEYSVRMLMRPPFDGTRYAYSEGTDANDDDFIGISERASENAVRAILSVQGDNVILQGSSTADTWHEVVLTVVVGGDLNFYIDGSQVDSATENIGYDNTAIDKTTFGALGRSSTGNYFGGLVDDVRTYNKALSSTEVLNLNNSGSIDG